MDDTIPLAKADESGRFKARLDVNAGDLFCLRARGPRGRLSPWVKLHIPETNGRARRIRVALPRIGMTDAGRARVRLFNIDPLRPISDPLVQLQFLNRRTKQKSIITLNARGTFRGRTFLPGEAGDRYEVYVYDDGTNRGLTRHSKRYCGSLVVPRSNDKNGFACDATNMLGLCLYGMDWCFDPAFDLRHFRGPLFHTRAAPQDVIQGEICNCDMAGAAGSLAHTHSAWLQKIIRAEGRGTYTVTFRIFDKRTMSYKPLRVRVTGELYVRPSGELLYGSAPGAELKGGPLWWPILEKAYAHLRGSYEGIGQGGRAHDLLEAVLGRKPQYIHSGMRSGSHLWKKLKAKIDEGWPVVACTAKVSNTLRYRNTRLFADHCYSVLGYEEGPEGIRIRLRNPWGEITPNTDDGSDRGIFDISLKTFFHLFEGFHTVH